MDQLFIKEFANLIVNIMLLKNDFVLTKKMKELIWLFTNQLLSYTYNAQYS